MRQIQRLIDISRSCELSYEEFCVFICILSFFVFCFLDLFIKEIQHMHMEGDCRGAYCVAK